MEDLKMEEKLRELMEKTGVLAILKSMDKADAIETIDRVFDALAIEVGRCDDEIIRN